MEAKTKIDVSVIIVNYGSADLVIDAVESVFAKTHGLTYEIIVVDNASADDSVAKLKKHLTDRIKLIESSENLGFGKANNLGAKYAEGEYLFLLNPDTILINNAIKVLYEYMRENQKVGIAGGNLYSPEMQAVPSYSLKFDTAKKEKTHSSWTFIILEKVRDKIEKRVSIKVTKPFSKEFNYTDNVKKVGYIYGADMMLSKALFNQVEGFDPLFFMYGEEEELSWRIVKKGYQIVNVPNARIIHLEGATTKNNSKFNERYFQMRMNGTMTYYHKCFGMKGVQAFYHYRLRRYHRLVLIAKLRRKDIRTTTAMRQYVSLKKTYHDYRKSIELEK